MVVHYDTSACTCDLTTKHISTNVHATTCTPVKMPNISGITFSTNWWPWLFSRDLTIYPLFQHVRPKLLERWIWQGFQTLAPQVMEGNPEIGGQHSCSEWGISTVCLRISSGRGNLNIGMYIENTFKKPLKIGAFLFIAFVIHRLYFVPHGHDTFSQNDRIYRHMGGSIFTEGAFFSASFARWQPPLPIGILAGQDVFNLWPCCLVALLQPFWGNLVDMKSANAKEKSYHQNTRPVWSRITHLKPVTNFSKIRRIYSGHRTLYPLARVSLVPFSPEWPAADYKLFVLILH